MYGNPQARYQVIMDCIRFLYSLISGGDEVIQIILSELYIILLDERCLTYEYLKTLTFAL